jgi:MerR HTH family regulatory protein
MMSILSGAAPLMVDVRQTGASPSHAERLHARGLLTIGQIADRLHVSRSTIKDWHRAGLLVSHKANDKNERLYEPPTPDDPRLVKHMGSRLAKRVLIEPTPGGAV